ncbi:MAG: MBL fold metallo-hydrolase [Burkholderiales bacterium]|nr:MBL fold metallo-hydrolase [Burkholderiales bacterium]
MQIRFWGTRGSLPAPLTTAAIREKLKAALAAAQGIRLDTPAAIDTFIAELPFSTSSTFGGDSSCVEIIDGEDNHLICDLGSGARRYGIEMLGRYGPKQPQTYHVFMSHLHWDHIMGFPFFPPAFIPGNRILIHSCHPEAGAAFRRQHGAPSFPVDFSQLPAAIEFVQLQPGVTSGIAGYRVTPLLQRHAGDSYGYRFEKNGKCVVYSTDSEHRTEQSEETEAFAAFFRNADLVIFDAMYSLADAVSVKEDWGHSSNVIGVELCQLAGAKRLCLFHHEPVFGDAQLEDILRQTRRLEEITRDGAPLEIISAWDGLVIEL